MSSAASPSRARWKRSSTPRCERRRLRCRLQAEPALLARPPAPLAGCAEIEGCGVSRPRVLIREPIAEAGMDLLRERFEVDVDANGDLAGTIGAYDAIVIRSATKLTAEV